MADRLNDASGALRTRWIHLPAAVRVGIIYVAARLVTTAFLAIAAGLSTTASRFGADATIADFAVGWDATWYWFVAVNGYPTELPRTAEGLVAENQWAFMPLYPFLANAVGLLAGSWGAGAVLVSLAAGYGAAYALYRLLRLRLDVSAATWAVVFFSAGPLAALCQVGYAEALGLLWLLLGLWALERRRYGPLALLVVLMAATRPGVLAFSLMLALYGIWRWFRRRDDPLGGAEIAKIILVGLLAAVAGFAWQLIAWLATGEASAYLSTELAWRRNWIPGAEPSFAPFEPLSAGVAFWAGIWGIPTAAVVGIVVLLVAGFALALWREPRVRRLGMPVRLWSASYLLYLLAVFFPQSSTFRLLLPLTPLWGAVAQPKAWWWRWGVLALCLAGQWWWIHSMYALAQTFWQVP